MLGGSNAVAGPYFNFTVPEPTGVVAIIAPDEPALLGLVSRIAPALAGGNAVVVVASETHPLAAIELAEAIATSDLPGGIAQHPHRAARRARARARRAHGRERDRRHGRGEEGAELEVLAADNVKRVVRAGSEQSPWEISAFLELKTVWHPVGT